jgi:hypothetical protein
MKIFFTLLFIFIFAAVPVISQKLPKQPPRALIYQAPDKTSFQEYSSPEKNFSIVFPGVPKVDKRDLDRAQVTIFSVARSASQSTVTVFEFQGDLEDSREQTFELFRSSLQKSAKLKIEAERNILFDGKAAKEFDLSENLTFIKIRIIVSGNRIYEIKTDVLGWQNLNQFNKARAAEFENESKRFFDSFKLLEGDKPQTVPVDFLGIIRETTYINKFFGFSLDFPADWEVKDPLETQEVVNAGVEALKTEEDKFNRILAASAKQEVIVFGVGNKKTETSENFLVGVLKQPNPRIDPETILRVTAEFLIQNPNIIIFEDIRSFEKNGTSFSTLTFLTTIRDFKIKQKIYVTVKKGYSITFTMSYIDEKQGRTLDKIFESVKFEPQK